MPRFLAGTLASPDNANFAAHHGCPGILHLSPLPAAARVWVLTCPNSTLELAGHPLLFHAVARLSRHPAIEQVFVVLAPGDVQFASYDWRAFGAKLTPLYCGGETRAASVFNGLLAANDAIGAADWVLVHDAARPCLGGAELRAALGQLAEDETEGTRDAGRRYAQRATAKAGATDESRENLWQARTPQMFRYRGCSKRSYETAFGRDR